MLNTDINIFLQKLNAIINIWLRDRITFNINVFSAVQMGIRNSAGMQESGRAGCDRVKIKERMMKRAKKMKEDGRKAKQKEDSRTN